MENTPNNAQPENVTPPTQAETSGRGPSSGSADSKAESAAAAPAGNNIELPKTTGKTPGGWNRFAGYNPNANKDKQGKRDRDRGPRKRG